jgi:hypothetical protein
MKIVADKKLMGTVNPFSNAIIYLGDRELQEKLLDQTNIGASDKSDQKRAAAVAKSGKRSSITETGELEDPEAERQRLMQMKDSDIEKLAAAETFKQTGRKSVGGP